MIQRRYHIRAGARTTAGGTVRTLGQWRKLDGVALALEGDPVDCPACSTQGVIQCIQPRLNERFNGRQYALHDDLCMCKCYPPPKLISEQTVVCQILAVADEASADEAQAATSITYDEQPRLVALPVEGLPYHIETKDGRKFSGRAGPDGLLPRIATEGAGDYTVYWGDEALSRSERGQS